MKKLLVTITSANEKQKINQENFECDNKVNACRMVLGYQPKRGYEVINVMIDWIEVLI